MRLFNSPLPVPGQYVLGATQSVGPLPALLASLAQGKLAFKATPALIVAPTAQPIFLVGWAEVTQVCLLLASAAWVYFGFIQVRSPLHVAVDTHQLF